jgi:hypothetical protein
MRRSALALGISIAWGLAVPELGRAYTFLNVIDSTGPYSQFPPPSINTAGDVAFRGDLDGGGYAILTGNVAGTSVVADTSGPYSVFLTEVAINDGGTVVFRADRDTVGGGIYTGPNPATDVVVDAGAAFVFQTVDLFAINAQGTVVFQAVVGGGGPRGLFIGTSAVVDDSGPFAFFGVPDINDAGLVAFRGSLDSLQSGIYTTSGTVADTSGPYAGFGEFVSINEAGTVAFTAFLTTVIGGSGVFVGDDPGTDTIADSSGPYKAFQQPSIDNAGQVTFYATLDGGGSGIFTGPDPVADRVIGTGDPLFGSTASSVNFFWKGSNDAGDVGFSYILANGRFGVGIATVPEPSRAAGSLVATALLVGWRALRKTPR